MTKSYAAACFLAAGLFVTSSILQCMDHLLVAYQQRQQKATCETNNNGTTFEENDGNDSIAPSAV